MDKEWGQFFEWVTQSMRRNPEAWFHDDGLSPSSDAFLRCAQADAEQLHLGELFIRAVTRAGCAGATWYALNDVVAALQTFPHSREYFRCELEHIQDLANIGDYAAQCILSVMRKGVRRIETEDARPAKREGES